MERILYLVRHGETDYVKDDRIQGRQNIPLNKKGFSEAKTLADYFKNKKIKIIITSNLKRSIQTGDLIFAIHGGSIKMILGLMKNIPENEFYTQTFINTGSIQIVKDKGGVFEIGENITVFH